MGDARATVATRVRVAIATTTLTPSAFIRFFIGFPASLAAILTRPPQRRDRHNTVLNRQSKLWSGRNLNP